MTVHELIAKLLLCDPDMEVYAMCDHGQSPEKVNSPSVIYVGNLDHTLWDDFTSYAEEVEEYGYTKKAIIL